MWFEIHECWAFSRPALYIGTEDGYIIGKLYSNRLTARLSALFHGFRYCI